MIVDIDFLKEGGQVFSNLLDAANVPETSRNALNNHRADVKKAFDQTGRDMKKDGGVNLLGKDAKESCEGLLNQLAEYGIFVVPIGEVESWLTELKVSGHGPEWLLQIFERMGADPAGSEYLRPQSGDVWAFVEKISKWLRNEDRKGMPK